MRPVHQMLIIPSGVIGLIFLPVLQVVAESIYHWKDDNGTSCYSNTTIPNGTTEFSVMPSAWPATSEAEVPDLAGKAEEDADKTSPVMGPGAASDSMMTILKERIERRRASIHSIENLLRTHSNDSGLRKRLYQKKQYLNEDMIRLELLAK